jgi:hypothetical protein
MWTEFYDSYMLAVVPVITAIVQVAKIAGLPDRLAPLTALVLGAALGLLLGWQTADAIRGLLAGLALGATSMGLYDGLKTTWFAKDNALQKQKQEQQNNQSMQFQGQQPTAQQQQQPAAPQEDRNIFDERTQK